MKPDSSKRACVSRVRVSDTDTLTKRVRHVFGACPIFGHACPSVSCFGHSCPRTVSACPENRTLFPLKKRPKLL